MSKRCAECKSDIDDDAIKCVHCDAYQNWRRYFRFSTTVLSLLVAFVSVTGLVLPILADLLLIKSSNMIGQVLSVGDINANSGLVSGEEFSRISYSIDLSLLLRNTGRGAGVVKKVEIWLHSGDTITASGKYIITSSEAVVRPNDYRVIVAKMKLDTKSSTPAIFRG